MDKPICFVSISIDADEAAWRAKIEKDSLDGIQLRVNEEDTFKKDYKISWIPRFLLIDREGKVLDANMTPAGWWKEYYCNRNQYFMIREFQENKLVRWFSFGLLTARLMAIIVKSKLKGYHRLRSQLIIKAVKDGLENKRGKVIDPQKYFAYLKEHGLE